METCEVIFTCIKTLYDLVQTVKGNAERCKEIGDRAQRLVPALRRVNTTPAERAKFARSRLFGELHSTLEAAIQLCSKYAEKHWLKKAMQANADDSTFDAIVERLGAALADVQFGLQLDIREMQDRWEAARQADNTVTQSLLLKLLHGQDVMLGAQAAARGSMDSGFAELKALIQQQSQLSLGGGAGAGAGASAGAGKQAALQRYRKRLSMYLKDGVLDRDEEEALQEEFGTDGITAADHCMILAEIQAKPQASATHASAALTTAASPEALAPQMYTVLKDRIAGAAGDDQLTVHQGDVVKLVQATDREWWWMELVTHSGASSAPGWVPASYVTVRGAEMFQVGQKLEALDNSEGLMLICVASIKAIDGPNLLISFDGWSAKFDYWAPKSSKDLHPVGYCGIQNLELKAPKGHAGVFEWEAYLTVTGAERAPADSPLWLSGQVEGCDGSEDYDDSDDALTAEPGQKLEAFDQKSRDMICVATVAEISSDTGDLFIHFDGWESGSYDYWCSPASPHLHPVGYCASVGHVLQPPNHYNSGFVWATYLSETRSVPVPAEVLL